MDISPAPAQPTPAQRLAPRMAVAFAAGVLGQLAVALAIYGRGLSLQQTVSYLDSNIPSVLIAACGALVLGQWLGRATHSLLSRPPAHQLWSLAVVAGAVDFAAARLSSAIAAHLADEHSLTLLQLISYANHLAWVGALALAFLWLCGRRYPSPAHQAATSSPGQSVATIVCLVWLWLAVATQLGLLYAIEHPLSDFGRALNALLDQSPWLQSTVRTSLLIYLLPIAGGAWCALRAQLEPVQGLRALAASMLITALSFGALLAIASVMVLAGLGHGPRFQPGWDFVAAVWVVWAAASGGIAWMGCTLLQQTMPASPGTPDIAGLLTRP